MLKAVFSKSSSERRPSNPLGRIAPCSAFASVCQRHRFESDWLLRAKELGWPTQIDFKDVCRRVQALQPELQGVVDGLVADCKEQDPSDSTMANSLRRRSLFWEEIVTQVREVGTNTAAGIGAQFSSFENTRPG